MDITSDYIPPKLFFSNLTENLFEKLKQNLFPINSSVFAKRMVVVPSRAMQRWIQLRLAKDLPVASGITTCFLNQAMHELFGIQFPSKLEWILNIENELCSLQEKWPLLKNYTKGDEKRVINLAKHLASLFVQYRSSWNTLFYESEQCFKNWQEELWNNLSGLWNTKNGVWNPKNGSWNIASGLWNTVLPKKEENLSIHLFSFSHIPAFYFHLLQHLPYPVYFYQLSMCQEFWSDLSNEHPVLTYLGKVGRKMAKLVEQSDILSEEIYSVPQGKMQLHRLQREMLFLEKEEVIKDDSIELHISKNEHHEIQNLFNTIVQLLENGSYEPKDILVMAPDITLYEPYIRAIFGKKLPFQIADMPLKEQHSEIEGLFLLLDLEKRRFSAPAVLEVFRNPFFKKKVGWGEEELSQIEKWIESTGIRWGFDAEHRTALLKKRCCTKGMDDEGATWKAGFGFLLEELAIPNHLNRIDFTQSSLLGEWIEVMHRLYSDLQLLQKRFTLRQWIDHLKNLHQTYFSQSETVFVFLEKLGQLVSRRSYCFDTIKPLLYEVMGEKKATINGHLIQAVQFCSMLPMRAIPTKVMCLIGMNEEAFPRKDHFNLEMPCHQDDYYPSIQEFDRYLILEACVSAREKLIISYLGYDPYDQTPLPPSPVVTHLLPYISKKIDHPFTFALKKKNPPSLFAICPKKTEIPQCQIDLMDFIRPFRSPLRHFLYHQKIFINEEKVLQEEEAFSLSFLRLAILRKERGDILKRAKREKDFPLGAFGRVAKMHLDEEAKKIPATLESRFVNLKVGNVQLVGNIEGILENQLCVFEKKTMVRAIHSWPIFLILAAIDPKIDTLFFIRDGKKLSRFFDDPFSYLNTLIQYYFLSKQMPSALFPEWVEPILKQQPDKIKNTLPYDRALRWALRFSKPLQAEELISQWQELAQMLFKEMKDAWF